MRQWVRLKADTHREVGRYRQRDLVLCFIIRRTFRPVVTLRLCRLASESKWLKWLLPPLKLIHRFACQLACMDLPWQLDAGGGLKFTHGWGVVITPGAKIGRNVTIFHGVTLGRRDRLSKEGVRTTGYPVIGDEVWIGPNAIIIGSVRIGEGSRIAGGAFVDFDVKPYSVVVGNPGQIVKEGCSPDVMNPAPQYGDELFSNNDGTVRK
jgi:serine O-acetyltransferase